MRRFSGLVLAGAVFAALACGGGSPSAVAPASSATPIVATAAASSIAPEWVALGVSLDGGSVINTTSTLLAISYTSGTCKDRVEKFAAPLEADGWKRTYATDDAESALIMVSKGDAKIAIVGAKYGDGVMLSNALTGTPPASSGGGSAPAAAAAPGSAAAPAGDAAGTAAAAPVEKAAPKKKKDCYNPWYTCDNECGNVGWSCKTSCPSVTDDCAGACGDVEWKCKRRCLETQWACDAG